MKKDGKYIALFVAIFILLVWVEYNAPKPVDWSATFSKKDKIPYGDYVVYDFMQDVFPGKDLIATRKPLYNVLSGNDTPHSNYIIVSNEFLPDTLDLNALFSYIKSGHSAFIAANGFYGPFADSLKLKVQRDYSFDALAQDSLSLNFNNPLLHSGKNFEYKKGTVNGYFLSYDTANTTVLGTNSKNEPVYIAIKYGEGKLYISTVPYAFTNYNALKGNNAEYIFRAMSYLPVADTYWDEYYKPFKERDTPIRFILVNAPLKAAYYLLLFGLILYIIFEGKRKQRIIPVILPLQNTSLEFVETIGRLYYQKGTHAGIAHKKIVFFLDYIRTKYNIPTTVYDDTFYTSLSAKTLIPGDELKNLFTFISRIQAASAIDETTLMDLNNKIENFYRKTA